MTPTLLDFMDGAACKGKGGLFYAPLVEPFHPVDFDPEPALALCRSCDQTEACRRWAVSVGEIVDGKAQHGVVAGVAPAAPVRMGSPITKTLRACALASCGRLFMGNATRRYCCDECTTAGRLATRQAHRERRRWAS